MGEMDNAMERLRVAINHVIIASTGDDAHDGKAVSMLLKAAGELIGQTIALSGDKGHDIAPMAIRALRAHIDEATESFKDEME